MRKITITFVLITLLAVAGFAAGSKEKTEQTWGPGRGMYQNSEDFTGEIVTITGKLEAEENDFPVLKSGNETYELMYHSFDTSNLNINDGDELTVKGYLVPGPRWDNDDEENHIMLTSATINGKEYIISDPDNFGPNGMRGSMGRGRGSMMGGPTGRRGR